MSIDDYIAQFPPSTQELLRQVQQTIRQQVPEGTQEVISYGIPTFKLNGNLVHYAGYQNHIGFYPGASGIKNFADKISAYKNAKGSVQFPLAKPIPFPLITEIVQFRVNEDLNKGKRTLRTCPQGHKYYKSTDCPTCPVCEKQGKPEASFLMLLSAPARRALINQGIQNTQQLAQFTEKEILRLHGLGPASIPLLLSALESDGLNFKSQ